MHVQRRELVCIVHFENKWVYLFEPSVRGVWKDTHKALTGVFQPVFNTGNKLCVSDSHYTLCCSGNKPVMWFLKVQIYTNAFHIWASLLHLEFTFWWLKVKIIIKSYFEDVRPSNQSVFRQCVFKWTFIYKYLFVIASLKILSVLYNYYLSFMYLYREKILYFFSIYLLRKKKNNVVFFLSIVLKLHFLVLVF